MYKRLYSSVLIIFSFILLMWSCAGSTHTGEENFPKTGSRQLRYIPIFYEYGAYREKGDNARLNCEAWGSFELENGTLPLEKNVRNGGKKVYRVNANGYGGLMFPLHAWGAFSLEQYYAKGCIEFDVMGTDGGEDFSIGLRSDTRGIVKNRLVSLSSRNVNVSRSWQRVKIPIKDIANDMNDGFSIQNIIMVEIENPKTQTFYLSEMYITSSDTEKQYPVVKVNQTGYRPRYAKFALVSCFPRTLNLSENTEFNVVNKAGDVRFTGTLQKVKDLDAASGETVFKADFSSLNEPGEYYISINNPHVGNSFAFNIGEKVYDGLFIDTLRYFYFQRQGIDLETQYAGIFARKNLHPGDSSVKKLSEYANAGTSTFDLSQGWYDAGDFGKYIPAAASAVGSLLFAFELFPDLFTDNQLNIPESGNGVPDFLDEIKWELDMMLKMQDSASGGFYEVANYMNVNGTQTIFIIDTNGENGEGNAKSTAATAAAGGILAHAYIVYSNIPRYVSFARQCLEASQRAWEYLRANPGNTWVSGGGRSYYHSQSEVNMLKFHAAAALYRATGQAQYQNHIIETYRSFDYNREFNMYHVSTIGPLGTGFIHYAMTENPNDAVMRFFENKFEGFQAGQLNNYRENSWPTVLVNWAYYWGSNDPICRIPLELYLCNRVLKKDLTVSVQLIRDSLHYILGINPLSFSFVSGYGENCVKNIFSGIYSNDGIDAIPKGYMAGGANQYEAGFMSNYISKCYVDSDGEWTTNEHAIYWNAVLVFSLAVEKGTADR